MQEGNTNTILNTKKHFFLKLIPPRRTFFFDITPEEREIMGRHGAYWREKMDQGIVIVFGPVLDPEYVYGMGVIEVEEEEQMKLFTEKDPVILANIGAKYEYYPMNAVVREGK